MTTTDPINSVACIGRIITRPCQRVRTAFSYARTGPNHELEGHPKTYTRNPGIEHEKYRVPDADPDMFTLRADPDFNRIRVRKITTFERNGSLYETIENDVNLPRHLWDDPSLNMRYEVSH